jgi:hypothetical protein
MLCLATIIRDEDPSVQRLLQRLDTPCSLTALVLVAWHLARVLAVQVVEAVLAARAREPTVWPAWPACGIRMQSKGCAPRQVLSVLGPIRWRRRVGRCPQDCLGPQVIPFDAALELQPQQRTSQEIQHLGGALAVFVPFATAATLLALPCGGRVSPRAGWAWVQVAGQRAMAALQAQLHAVAAGDLPAAAPLAAAVAALPLVLGADGVMVPFRPAGGDPRGKTAWHAVKVGILARVGHYRTRTGQVVVRLRQRRVVAVVGGIEALQQRLWLAALRQGLREAPQVVWLSDGARGLWRLFAESFAPSARGILDFYHAAQHLWKAAAAWLDGRTSRARQWFDGARHRMRHGHPEGVLADLAAALEGEDLPATVRETLTTVAAYVAKHRDHINYEAYKALGLPLGSGMVESACKGLSQQRFKGVGMRWSAEGFNHLLPLRLAWVNGSFETLFQMQGQDSPNM